MSEELANSPDATSGGQADSSASSPAAGQAEGSTPSSEGQASAPSAVEDFFDPSSIKDNPELQKAYKQMQGAFTKKMQETSKKLAAAEQYEKAVAMLQQDPKGFLGELAKQHGFALTKAEAAAAAEGEWNPNTWEEVIERSTSKAKAEVLEAVKPLFEELHRTRASSFEAALDEADPMWRNYEKEFRETLQAHPSLATDAKKLFKLAMPDDYVMSRATQAALKKLQGQTDAVKVGSKSTTRAAESAATKINSFDDAVAQAKAMIAAGRGFV